MNTAKNAYGLFVLPSQSFSVHMPPKIPYARQAAAAEISKMFFITKEFSLHTSHIPQQISHNKEICAGITLGKLVIFFGASLFQMGKGQYRGAGTEMGFAV